MKRNITSFTRDLEKAQSMVVNETALVCRLKFWGYYYFWLHPFKWRILYREKKSWLLSIRDFQNIFLWCYINAIYLPEISPRVLHFCQSHWPQLKSQELFPAGHLLWLLMNVWSFRPWTKKRHFHININKSQIYTGALAYAFQSNVILPSFLNCLLLSSVALPIKWFRALTTIQRFLKRG